MDRVRRGTTLVETLWVLALVGVLLTLTVPYLASLRDRAHVRGAAVEVIAALSTARHAAIARGVAVAIRVDGAAGHLWVFVGGDTLQRRSLGAQYGVSLEATRDSIAYAPTGRGSGAANTQIVLRRGSVAETVTVSRLGRTRR